jgi:hypothetical protein
MMWGKLSKDAFFLDIQNREATLPYESFGSDEGAR